MANRSFILQRICNFARTEFDPDIDTEVVRVLKARFNIVLPQRPTLDDSLASAISDHEILTLIRQYRDLK